MEALQGRANPWRFQRALAGLAAYGGLVSQDFVLGFHSAPLRGREMSLPTQKDWLSGAEGKFDRLNYNSGMKDRDGPTSQA
jgi:hypothetical protein